MDVLYYEGTLLAKIRKEFVLSLEPLSCYSCGQIQPTYHLPCCDQRCCLPCLQTKFPKSSLDGSPWKFLRQPEIKCFNCKILPIEMEFQTPEERSFMEKHRVKSFPAPIIIEDRPPKRALETQSPSTPK